MITLGFTMKEIDRDQYHFVDFWEEWNRGDYPFELLEPCQRCLSEHAEGKCSNPAHRELSRVAREQHLEAFRDTGKYQYAFRATREQFVNVRELFAHLYAEPKPIEPGIQYEHEKEEVACSK